MKLMKCIFYVLASCLCQALQDLDPENVGHRFQSKTNANVSEFNDESNGSVGVVHHAGTCVWSLEGAGNQSVALSLTTRESGLLDRVCVDLGCGRAYNVTESDQLPGAGICLAGCSYRDRRLYNCTEEAAAVGGGGVCLGVTQVVCDPLLARLVGGAHRCGGRVELWAGGAWGTVCDDRWDLADAHVVCRQLGCGYAVEVSGQGGRFPPGAAGAPVLLDELMCTGAESSLWACPLAPPGAGHHDCGHKEDAGVVCSEMRAVRLSGGADRCAGRVEIHVNGTWGTVCDTCWDRQAAAMTCSMLGCGAEPQKYAQFEPPLGHAGGPRWYYQCDVQHTALWQCREFVNVPHICEGSKAAGLVCAGSKGFLTVSTPKTRTWTGLTTALAAGNTTGSAWDHFLFTMSPELIGCVVLSVLLLVLLIAYCILCFHCRRRRDALALQQRSQQQEKSFNDYKPSVSLLQVSSGPGRTPVLPEPSAMRTQCSSRDCNQPCHPPAFHMSTFNNSRRHWRGQSSPQAGSVVNSLYRHSRTNHADTTIKHRSLNPSADSFESSTSSEQNSRCYEDQKEDRAPADPNELGGLYMDFEDPSFPLPTSSRQQPTRERVAAMLDPGYGGRDDEDDDEDDVYSPVSPDSCSSTTEDYDDVAQLS